MRNRAKPRHNPNKRARTEVNPEDDKPVAATPNEEGVEETVKEVAVEEEK